MALQVSKEFNNLVSQDWKVELKQSPIFNMSLSSKELFHSNFIAWVCETYSAEIGEFFSKFLKLEKVFSISNMHRELHNIDLSFTLGDTLILIENKVKSIAYQEQLDKYKVIPKEKFGVQVKSVKYILLSLKEPLLEMAEWKCLSYAKLAECFSTLSTKISTDSYHALLLKDYVWFIQCIEENILQKIDLIIIQLSKLYVPNTKENNLLKELEALRMHDFFLKGLFESLANELTEYLENDASLKDKVTRQKASEASNGSISIGFGMTRAQGLLEIAYKINDITIGIQLQGEQYRQYIVGAKKPLVEKLAEQLNKDEEWFQFNNYPKDNNFEIDIYPKGEKKFNVFDAISYKMLYRSVKLVNIKNTELLEIIIKDIHEIISLEGTIKLKVTELNQVNSA
jgi:hypothetical protein